jgi:membrane protease YdiL (CAAX protease family)
MTRSRLGCVFIATLFLPICALSATFWGLGLLPAECLDMRFHFKLLLWGPVVEELVFRAGLLTWLATKINSKLMANGVTSALFAITHWAVSGNVATLLVFAPSIALGWAYQRTQSLILAIGLHILFNLTFFSLSC